MDEVRETKKEARKRHREEFQVSGKILGREQKGVIIGCRNPVSAKKVNSDQRIGKCLCCGGIGKDCICSGYMTEAAQDRFFRSRD